MSTPERREARDAVAREILDLVPDDGDPIDLAVVPVVDSTSTELRRRSERGDAGPGAILIADRQTAGRGRRGRSWWSPAGGGLYLSALFAPSGPPERLSRWSLAAAAATAEACRAVGGRDVAVQWPNDVLIRGRKLAGILVESWTAFDARTRVAVGIGINLRPPPGATPPEGLSGRIATLEEGDGAIMSRVSLAAGLIRNLRATARSLDAGHWGEVRSRWTSLAPEADGAPVRTASGTGVTAGIDDDGALRVRRTADGRIVALRSIDSVSFEE